MSSIVDLPPTIQAWLRNALVKRIKEVRREHFEDVLLKAYAKKREKSLEPKKKKTKKTGNEKKDIKDVMRAQSWLMLACRLTGVATRPQALEDLKLGATLETSEQYVTCLTRTGERQYSIVFFADKTGVGSSAAPQRMTLSDEMSECFHAWLHSGVKDIFTHSDDKNRFKKYVFKRDPQNRRVNAYLKHMITEVIDEKRKNDKPRVNLCSFISDSHVPKFTKQITNNALRGMVSEDINDNSDEVNGDGSDDFEDYEHVNPTDIESVNVDRLGDNQSGVFNTLSKMTYGKVRNLASTFYMYTLSTSGRPERISRVSCALRNRVVTLLEHYAPWDFLLASSKAVSQDRDAYKYMEVESMDRKKEPSKDFVKKGKIEKDDDAYLKMVDDLFKEYPHYYKAEF